MNIKVYIAGKVAKNSSFGKHHWRDEFLSQISSINGINFENLDPLKLNDQHVDPESIFKADCKLIKECDVFVVYLSDDISVGGSQEILIAKYYGKPVVALAPKGGKFNGCKKEMLGKTIENYKDPFVFSTCDVVCDDLLQVAEVLKNPGQIQTKSFEKLLRP